MNEVDRAKREEEGHKEHGASEVTVDVDWRGQLAHNFANRGDESDPYRSRCAGLPGPSGHHAVIRVVSCQRHARSLPRRGAKYVHPNTDAAHARQLPDALCKKAAHISFRVSERR